MTKRDFVIKIAKETGMQQSDVGNIVQKVFDSLVEGLACGRTVELRNFGIFEVLTRKERKGRNPHFPEREMVIPERTVVRFRAGKVLKQRVESLTK